MPDAPKNEAIELLRNGLDYDLKRIEDWENRVSELQEETELAKRRMREAEQSAASLKAALAKLGAGSDA